jgi:hypothetical protein
VIARIQTAIQASKATDALDIVTASFAFFYLLADHIWGLDIPDHILVMGFMLAVSVRTELKRRRKATKKRKKD